MITKLDIPKQELKRPGENPRFLKIEGMQAVDDDPDVVRLFVPASEYGVNSIVVKIPN